MLYDEPTTGLDPIMSDVITDLILQTRRRHPVTSIVVTHDLNTVHKVADRVVMLCPFARLQPGEKQILFDGTPKELKACADARVQEFQGSAGGNQESGIGNQQPASSKPPAEVQASPGSTDTCSLIPDS